MLFSIFPDIQREKPELIFERSRSDFVLDFRSPLIKTALFLKEGTAYQTTHSVATLLGISVKYNRIYNIPAIISPLKFVKLSESI